MEKFTLYIEWPSYYTFYRHITALFRQDRARNCNRASVFLNIPHKEISSNYKWYGSLLVMELGGGESSLSIIHLMLKILNISNLAFLQIL